jgi:hypothetical protein
MRSQGRLPRKTWSIYWWSMLLLLCCCCSAAVLLCCCCPIAVQLLLAALLCFAAVLLLSCSALLLLECSVAQLFVFYALCSMLYAVCCMLLSQIQRQRLGEWESLFYWSSLNAFSELPCHTDGVCTAFLTPSGVRNRRLCQRLVCSPYICDCARSLIL